MRAKVSFRSLVLGLPAAIYACDAEGYITFFNEAAAALWGRTPELQVERWCGALKIFRPDGTPVALDLCPMALGFERGTRGALGTNSYSNVPTARAGMSWLIRIPSGMLQGRWPAPSTWCWM